MTRDLPPRGKDLEAIYERRFDMVYRVCFLYMRNQSDTEDAVSTVFVKLLEQERTFDSVEHEKAWLIRITINQCKDYRKNKWNNSTIGFEHIPESEKAYFKVPHVESDDTLWAVLELKENYRRPLYLFYYEDYSIKESAALLHIPENTVKTNLKRGREQVKKLLDLSEHKRSQ